MSERIRIDVLSRREFVLGASAAAAIALVMPLSTSPAAAKKDMDAAMKAVAGDATPIVGKVSLELPEIAENGNTVPFTVNIESPMTDADYVKSVHVFANGNPQPDVATFYFTPASGKASATSRMRLAKTQDIIAVAEMSDGKFYMGKQTVKVTIGGCGG